MTLKTRISKLEVTAVPTEKKWAASVGVYTLDEMISYLKSIPGESEFDPPEHLRQHFSRLGKITDIGWIQS